MEYLIICQGGRGKTLEYALNWQPPQHDNQPVLAGLCNVHECSLESQKSGQNDNPSGSGRPRVGGVSDSGRPVQNGLDSAADMGLSLNEWTRTRMNTIQGH
jgi:hypothetical protein